MHFNPRSPRGGATYTDYRADGLKTISIHAPHEGERHNANRDLCDIKSISIHAPHEGERLRNAFKELGANVFQSTLPTRGSDLIQEQIVAEIFQFQSTLPTRGSDVGLCL